MRARTLGLIAMLAVLAQFYPAGAAVGKTWEMSGTKDFSSGKLDGISMLSTGEMLLGPEVDPISGLTSGYVWDLETGGDGRIFVGAQAPAVVGVIKGDKFTVLHKTSEKVVLSVLPLEDGSVLAATAPRGIIYKIDAAGAVTIFKEIADAYVWDMALGAKGEIYCATGPHGKLLQFDAKGDEKELFRARQKHLMCLAVDPKSGAVYAGTQPDGLVYRIEPDGKASVLYDAQESEVRTLLVAPDGRLYVGTAQADGGAPKAPVRPPSPSDTSGRKEAGASPPSDRDAWPAPALPDAPRGANSLYRVEPGGGVVRVINVPGVLIMALALKDGKDLMVGTGNRGRLIAVDQADDTARVVTDFVPRYISAMATDADGAVVLGTSGSGGLWRIGVGHRSAGVFQSEAFDAGHVARWGRAQWKAIKPAAAQLGVTVRTGNSRRPDSTWSDWSPPVTTPGGGAVKAQPGRFAQMRCEFTTKDKTVSPTVIQLSLSYRQLNRRPSVREMKTDAKGSGNGGDAKRAAGPPPSPARAKAANGAISWTASDPNGDELIYDLYYRAVDEKGWKTLKKDIKGTTRYKWQTERLPDGHYLLRLVASDRMARPADEALEDELVTKPILIDNRRPEVLDLQAKQTEDGYLITGIARDGYSRISSIRVSHDAGDWGPVFPEDGILDSTAEGFTWLAGPLEEGEHVFVFTATDARGNVGSGKALVIVDDKDATP